MLHVGHCTLLNGDEFDVKLRYRLRLLLQPSVYVRLSALCVLNGGSGVVELSGAKLPPATALHERKRHKSSAASRLPLHMWSVRLHCVGQSACSCMHKTFLYRLVWLEHLCVRWPKLPQQGLVCTSWIERGQAPVLRHVLSAQVGVLHLKTHSVPQKP